MHEPARHRLLGRWSRVVSRRPKWVLFIAVAIATASVAVTFGQLRFNPDRNDLISDRLDWNQRYLHWVDTFSGSADFVVLIDTFNRAGRADDQMAAQARALIDELGPRLAHDPWVAEAVWGYETAQVGRRAIRLQPMEAFRRELDRIASARVVLQSPTPQDLASRATSAMNLRTVTNAARPGPVASDEHDALVPQIEAFAHLIGAFAARLETPPQQDIGFAAMAADSDRTDWEYLTTRNGRLLVIRVVPALNHDSLTPYETALGSVRSILDEFAGRYGDVAFGLTGVDVIESDETDAATRDATKASIVATVLIAVLLMAAFHSWRVPLLLMVTLAIAIAWSFGFLTLVVGHLQVLSVVFTVILLGLGVAFGIHIASRYELVRHLYVDRRVGFRRAIKDTFETIGPGVVTGAVTTAAAFSTILLTDFKGVAEMGLIAAAGILLCVIAMFSVFPALLRIAKPRHKHVVRMEHRRLHIFEERWVGPFSRHPVATLAVATIAMALSLVAITQMRFDFNLLALMPQNVDSIRWQRRATEDGDQSIYYGISIVNSMLEARRRAADMRRLPTVSSITGVGRLIPEDDAAKTNLIRQVREQLGDDLAFALEGRAPEQVSESRGLVGQLGTLGLGIKALTAVSAVPAALAAPLEKLSASIDRFLAAAASLEPGERDRRLAALGRDYGAWRSHVAGQIDAALDPSPLRIEDLPAHLMAPYVAGEGDARQLVLEIHPKLPPGLSDPLDPRFLGRFIHDLESVDAQITGVIAQFYYSGVLILGSYIKAGIYALIVVFVLVWIDFRSVRDAALTLVPVAIGFAVTFGVMQCLGMQINPANIIVLPLMFGLGVDDGVHMLHRYRQDPTTRPLGLTAGTGKGITLTSFTTMIGFGSLLLASHRGMASLGFVLTLGIGLTMLACWTVMPAILELRARRAVPVAPAEPIPRLALDFPESRRARLHQPAEVGQPDDH